MNLNTVIAICLLVVTAGIAALIIYTILILSDFRKMMKPVNRMVNEFHGEFKPLLNDMSGITGSINSLLSRLDRLTGIVFGKTEFIASSGEKVSSYLKKFIANPKVELQSISAGLKKGMEVLFKKKGE